MTDPSHPGTPVCPNCGKAVLPEMVWCQACGAQLQAVPPPPEAAAPAEAVAAPTAPVPAGTCPACNDPITADMVWCGACGHQLREPPRVKGAGKGGGKGVLIGAAVLVLAGGGAAGWWFFLRTPPPVKTAGPTVTAPTGPSAAEQKKGEELRKAVRLEIREERWEQAERLLADARRVDPTDKELAVLEKTIREARLRKSFRRPERLTEATPAPLLPTCFRPAVANGGEVAAVIGLAGGGSVKTDTVQVLDSRTGQARWSRTLALEGKQRPALMAIAFSPDGASLAVGSTDGKLRLLAAQDNGRDIEEAPHAGSVADLAFIGDGSRILAINDDGKSVVYSVKPLKAVETIEGAPGGAGVMAVDPAGKVFVSVEAKGLRVRTLGEPKADRTLNVEGGVPSALAISPDGATVAAGTVGGQVTLLDLKSGNKVASGKPLEERLTQLVFDASGSLLVAWSDRSGKMSYLTVPQLDPLESVETGLEPPTRLAASLDGGAFVVVGNGPADSPLTSRVAVFRLGRAR